MAVKLAGNEEEEVQELASMGAHGTSPGNINSDLQRRWYPELWSPTPRLFKVPYKESKTSKTVLFTDIQMYLPSDWLRALAQNPDLEFEYDALFGIS